MFLGIFGANGWTGLFTAAAGGLLLFGAAQHLLAKTMSLIVGVALGAAAVIALISGNVLGLAAANSWTKIGWAGVRGHPAVQHDGAASHPDRHRAGRVRAGRVRPRTTERPAGARGPAGRGGARRARARPSSGDQEAEAIGSSRRDREADDADDARLADDVHAPRTRRSDRRPVWCGHGPPVADRVSRRRSAAGAPVLVGSAGEPNWTTARPIRVRAGRRPGTPRPSACMSADAGPVTRSRCRISRSTICSPRWSASRRSAARSCTRARGGRSAATPRAARSGSRWVRPNPIHASDDPELVRELIRNHPWATLISSREGQLVASHYPVLLDESTDELAIVTHVGRPDDQVHGFGDEEMLVIVQGRHGYISPSWYAPGATRAPTWNFTVAHCYGVPQVLDAEENIRVLARLVEHFERHVDAPVLLDPETAARLAPGHGRHPPADHPLRLQAQAQPGQGHRQPASGDRGAACPRSATSIPSWPTRWSGCCSTATGDRVENPPGG